MHKDKFIEDNNTANNEKSGVNMFNIIVYGDKKDLSISRTLIKCLRNYGGIQYSLQDEIGCSCGCIVPSFFLFDECSMKKVTNFQKGCVIFKNSFTKFPNSLFPTHFTPIFNTHNMDAPKVLSNTDKIVITCGTSAKDTLSLASLKEDKALISLQRYIKTFNSNIIEPHDFTVKFSRHRDVYSILSTCAVLLLSEITPNNGYVI